MATDRMYRYGGAVIMALVMGVGLGLAFDALAGVIAGLAAGLTWLGVGVLMRRR